MQIRASSGTARPRISRPSRIDGAGKCEFPVRHYVKKLNASGVRPAFDRWMAIRAEQYIAAYSDRRPWSWFRPPAVFCASMLAERLPSLVWILGSRPKRRCVPNRRGFSRWRLPTYPRKISDACAPGRLTAMAPAPPRKMKVAGALAVPPPRPSPNKGGRIGARARRDFHGNASTSCGRNEDQGQRRSKRGQARIWLGTARPKFTRA